MRYLLLLCAVAVLAGCATEINEKEFAKMKAKVAEHEAEIDDLIAIENAQNEQIKILVEVNRLQGEAIHNLTATIKIMQRSY